MDIDAEHTHAAQLIENLNSALPSKERMNITTLLSCISRFCFEKTNQWPVLWLSHPSCSSSSEDQQLCVFIVRSNTRNSLRRAAPGAGGKWEKSRGPMWMEIELYWCTTSYREVGHTAGPHVVRERRVAAALLNCSQSAYLLQRCYSRHAFTWSFPVIMMWFSFSLNQRKSQREGEGQKEREPILFSDAEAAVKLCDVIIHSSLSRVFV